MSSEFVRTLGRWKFHKLRGRLRPRPAGALPFLGIHDVKPGSLLYDTTVYIDILQGRFPATAQLLLQASDAWHSSVAENELAAACALLDPDHPNTATVIYQIAEVIDRLPAHRMIAPDRDTWRQAGILAGTLARLQQTAKPERRKILNDALIFSSARKFGHTVLTRNVSDFDLLQQLQPSGRVLFYRL